MFNDFLWQVSSGVRPLVIPTILILLDDDGARIALYVCRRDQINKSVDIGHPCRNHHDRVLESYHRVVKGSITRSCPTPAPRC